jgi:hypothetical protein
VVPQVAGLRDKLAVVLGKTANDDKLIAALRTELAAVSGGSGSNRCAPARHPTGLQPCGVLCGFVEREHSCCLPTNDGALHALQARGGGAQQPRSALV